MLAGTAEEVRRNVPSDEITKAFDTLGLKENEIHTKKSIGTQYRRLAKTLHPDKGGTHEQFLALSEAYLIVLGWVETNNVENLVQNKKQTATVTVTLSVAEALAKLYKTISDVHDKLNAYGTSDNIPLNQLLDILQKIQKSLRDNILDKTPVEATFDLQRAATNLDICINNVHSGPTPAFAAVVAGAFATIALGILALMIALSPPAGIVLGTAVLSGLIATPPVGGLLFGTFCFFAAKSAHKNRSEQQQEMRKIVTAIYALARSITIDGEIEEIDGESKLLLTT